MKQQAVLIPLAHHNNCCNTKLQMHFVDKLHQSMESAGMRTSVLERNRVVSMLECNFDVQVGTLRQTHT